MPSKNLKRSSVPNGKPVDISKDRQVILPENFYQINETTRKELGLDTEEELIISPEPNSPQSK